eukprot:TRINITY_DN84057_c0_g1_i1.p1 TRINITY_DN84057_c0_g1~~TRINITY_DN84057_c0_g1_i1.p1  ORF type:complete len:181 (-),score=29.70 TRINITY_DN84057_c0_g1_i1:258-800(-)
MLILDKDSETPLEVLAVSGKPTSGILRVQFRDLLTGNIEWKSFERHGRFEALLTTKAVCSCLYLDEDTDQWVFMDKDSLEELRIHKRFFGAKRPSWLVEGNDVEVLLHDGKIVQFGRKPDVIETVVETPNLHSFPQGAFKAHPNKLLRLSNGETLYGPKYLKVGDKVELDPSTGKIIRRV